MDATTALIVVGVLVLAAIVAAAGGFDRQRRARGRVRRTVAEAPVPTRSVTPVVEERVTRRVVE